MPETTVAGNHGGKVRSDCRISLELASEGGIQIISNSRVSSLYGESNNKLIHKILSHYKVQNARVHFDDSGALEWVIAARLETVIRSCTGGKKGFTFKQPIRQNRSVSRDSFRFTRLYLPGNTPSMMINSGIHGPEGIILDLEDSVAPSRKDEARILVRNALLYHNFYQAERMVRINPMPDGIKDLEEVIPALPDLILLPKCESETQILEVVGFIGRTLKGSGIEKDIWLMPIIESALGVENAFSIAVASDRIVAMALGLEDYTADIGAERTLDARESFYARSRVLNACKAARIQAIDSVFSDVDNEEGLRMTVKKSKQMGFEGIGCIHPRQIGPARDGFLPGPDELEKALKINDAFQKAESEGLGVVAVGSKMIDPPVVKRALRTIELAIKFKILEPNREGKFNEE
jgi:citrate lyase subunit beta/citryl-CoA lyase